MVSVGWSGLVWSVVVLETMEEKRMGKTVIIKEIGNKLATTITITMFIHIQVLSIGVLVAA